MKFSDSLASFYHRLDRSYFMEFGKELAHEDSALSIGYGQTISQPSLVHFMIRELSLEKDHHVLEIGTGSGYQTAFLAEFAEAVVTIERIEPLQTKAKERLDALGYTNITYIYGDGTDGHVDNGPYDRIIVSAAAKSIPPAYVDQLKPGGILIMPVGDHYVQQLVKATKKNSGSITTENLELVRFVPLVGKYEI